LGGNAAPPIANLCRTKVGTSCAGIPKTITATMVGAKGERSTTTIRHGKGSLTSKSKCNGAGCVGLEQAAQGEEREQRLGAVGPNFSPSRF